VPHDTKRLSPDELACQVLWLMAAVRAEAPGLPVEQARDDALRMSLGTPDRAGGFHRALLAENIDADLDDRAVELHLAAWYTSEDVESIALAVAKVAHYLGI
jgi:hypothetical protein